MKLLLTTCLLLIISQLHAQNYVVSGVVNGPEGALPFVNLVLEGTELGATTDVEGQFKIQGVPGGDYTLLVSAVGFKRKELAVTVASNISLPDIEMEEDVLGLEEVVITGNLRPTYVKDSPVKIDVITTKHLQTYLPPAASLIEGVQLINGVQEAVACGVCFTNSISINGLPGAYTAVLMDGSPIYGSLASVYGLNGIPTQIVDRFEVIKGPSSTLYGSEAVAGVINVITKDPKKQPPASVDVMYTSHNELFTNTTLAPKLGKVNGYIGLNTASINHFEDRNGDGFGDLINLDRYSVFSKWTLDRASKKPFSLTGKFYYEDRRNGVEDYLIDRAYTDIRGNDSIYGESIYTKRVELIGSYALNTKQDLKLDASFSHHDQDSYYGADHYVAKQTIGFFNFIWDKKLGNHQLVSGLTGRYQLYNDNTVATGDTLNGVFTDKPDEQVIPGLFVQDEWRLSDKSILMLGGRLDHYSAHGPIFSPRVNFKQKAGDWTTFRLNFGTGFRIVNLFAEDHAFVTGQREVVIEGDISPERSYNFTLNTNHVYVLGEGQGMLDVDAFYTYFTNRIAPDYDEPGLIIYSNSIGHAETMGLGANITHSFKFPLNVKMGATFQKVTRTEPDGDGKMVTEMVENAPEWSGIAAINYVWKKAKTTFAYSANFTGPMRLPTVFDLDGNGDPMPNPRPERSLSFSTHNMQVTKVFKKGFSLYGGVQNIFDQVQDYSPLTGYNDPNAAPGFSSSFDTAYAYGPTHGREFYLGFRWDIGKRK